jgi:fructosamine-3-kinase
VHCDTSGNPALIDPAVYWGWPEAELAMTKLFGGFEREFYESYESCSNISNDWYSRAPLYNLYHLLNHLILFGGNYLMQIRESIKKFV